MDGGVFVGRTVSDVWDFAVRAARRVLGEDSGSVRSSWDMRCGRVRMSLWRIEGEEGEGHPGRCDLRGTCGSCGHQDFAVFVGRIGREAVRVRKGRGEDWSSRPVRSTWDVRYEGRKSSKRVRAKKRA